MTTLGVSTADGPGTTTGTRKTTGVVRTKVVPWLLTAALLAGAWTLSKVTLPLDSAQAPFVTVATLGETASARNLEITVTDVHAARSVVDDKGWSTEGTWLVVDLEAAARATQKDAFLRTATLSIGDRLFSATDRAVTFLNQGLVPGVPRAGSLAFELPPEALTGSGVLRLGAANPVLDGVVELTIELDELPVESEVALEENGWAR